MKPTIHLLALAFGLMFLAACNPVRPLETAPAAETGSGQSVVSLAYAGPEEPGSGDTSRCAMLKINNNEAEVQACDGTGTTVPVAGNQAWSDIGNRFAAFDYESPSEQLTFDGSGEIHGPEWERAILAWARITRAELATGHVSAAARTAVSWNLGPVHDSPDVCAHLTVLDYGYAYAERRSCEDNTLVSSVEGWLEQAEMEQLDAWFYGYSPLYSDDNYINGVGETNMPEGESANVQPWAEALWTRLAGMPLADADTGASDTGSAQGCAAEDADSQVYSSPDYGFCIVIPAGYAIVETVPGNLSLVKGGDIMNHVDPRVSIEISEAGERTLAQVADNMVASYVLAGETADQQPVGVGGAEGVLLDNLVGQDLNRRVAVIHNGRIYSLMMMPLSDEAEPFFQGVLDSWQFLPGEQ